jgi:hypothetical protein
MQPIAFIIGNLLPFVNLFLAGRSGREDNMNAIPQAGSADPVLQRFFNRQMTEAGETIERGWDE